MPLWQVWHKYCVITYMVAEKRRLKVFLDKGAWGGNIIADWALGYSE